MICKSTWGEEGNYNVAPECGQPATHESAWTEEGPWLPVCQKHAERASREYGAVYRPIDTTLRT